LFFIAEKRVFRLDKGGFFQSGYGQINFQDKAGFSGIGCKTDYFMNIG